MFVRLLTAAHHKFYSLLLSLVGNRQNADDLMQELSLVLWRKFGDFDSSAPDPESGFLRWGRTVARNLVRNFHRLRQTPTLAFSDELITRIASTQLAAEELLELRRQALFGCLKKLGPAERRLVQACYSHHDSIQSAASTLGRTPNSVYKRLRIIRRKLLDCVTRTLNLEGSLGS